MPEEKAEQASEEQVSESQEEQTKPFNEEQEARMQQLITNATSQAKEDGRREMQGIKDREVSALTRRAESAEGRANSYQSSLSGLDEDTQRDAQLNYYKSQEQVYQSQAQQETQKQQQDANYSAMQQSITDEVKTRGIDPKDSRIDYAQDADYVTGRRRFNESLVRIEQDNRQKADTESQKKITDQMAEMERKLRKDMGLDSVDTTTGEGGNVDDDADFKKGIGDGSLPLNKENMARAKKLGMV